MHLGTLGVGEDLVPCMYILECSDKSFYAGCIWDLERRLSQHEAGGGARYTARRRPVRLAYCEEFTRIEDAFARGKQVQSRSRAKRIALIEGRYQDIKSDME
jgi:putative endonuclease